jgi:hypothetical protein
MLMATNRKTRRRRAKAPTNWSCSWVICFLLHSKLWEGEAVPLRTRLVDKGQPRARARASLTAVQGLAMGFIQRLGVSLGIGITAAVIVEVVIRSAGFESQARLTGAIGALAFILTWATLKWMDP